MSSKPPHRMLHLAEIDSTNADAMRRAGSGECGPLWIVAERQTHGRGRSGRNWQSLPGNLHASLLFVPGAAVSTLHQLSLLAGVAVHDALGDVLIPPAPALRLKWPNDCLIGAEKIGGVLVETTTWAGTMVAVIGIGINCAHAPEIDGRRATALIQHGCLASPREVLHRLALHMDRRLCNWQAGAGFAQLRDDWLARGGPVGERLAINAGTERIEGFFAGLDRQGALLLHDDHGALRRLTYGDVTILETRLSGADRP